MPVLQLLLVAHVTLVFTAQITFLYIGSGKEQQLFPQPIVKKYAVWAMRLALHVVYLAVLSFCQAETKLTSSEFK